MDDRQYAKNNVGSVSMYLLQVPTPGAQLVHPTIGRMSCKNGKGTLIHSHTWPFGWCVPRTV
eukprot:scaffold433412_cov22-Prasinocladus_malaysianus.AAC.2